MKKCYYCENEIEDHDVACAFCEHVMDDARESMAADREIAQQRARAERGGM